MKHIFISGSLLMALVGVALFASGATAAPAAPPHLSPVGQNEYRAYTESPDHRAFAIAPGGSWGWVSSEATAQIAEEQALSICQGQTEQPCVSYAVDDKVVFDAANWPRLWRPYASAAEARKATVGRERGQRMHDLAFRDAQGKQHKLSSLLGKVVVLHFWGAWCPPCRREMPELQKIRQSLADRADLAFVLLQAREKIDVSRQWADKEGIEMPLADSGSTGDDDTAFRLANGGQVNDRQIANRFPTTYVLDRNGLVVFSHVGPIYDWLQYKGFLLDLLGQSKR